MEQITNFGDRRQLAFCVYCGGTTETREHIPSRVFLDEPYPENLPTIMVCEKCNHGYSFDEEYVACLIECARVGGVEKSILERKKIKIILAQRPKLLARLKAMITSSTNTALFSIEANRIERVLAKLVRGHMLFDQNEPWPDSSIELKYGGMEMFNDASRRYFESIPIINFLPEVGSRAMQRMLVTADVAGTPWIEVQSNRYRYLSSASGIVRIVLSEYVWCEALLS